MNGTTAVELMRQWIESEELRGRAGFVMAPAGADADGDGESNSSEFQAGTNPTNSTSVARLGTNSSLRFRKPAHRSALIQPSETLGASALWWPWPEGAVPEFSITPRE